MPPTQDQGAQSQPGDVKTSPAAASAGPAATATARSAPTRPLRVAIWHNLSRSDAKRALYYYVMGLVDRGHHVEAWCPSTADDTFFPLSELVTEHRLPFQWPSPPPQSGLGALLAPRRELIGNMAALVQHCRQCAQEISARGFDVLLAHPCAVMGAPPIGRLLSIAKVLYLAEPYRAPGQTAGASPWIAPPSAGRNRWKPAHLWSLLRDVVATQAWRIGLREELRNAQAFDLILAPSLFGRESIVRAYGLDVRLCYPAVDVEFFCNRRLPRADFVLGLGACTSGNGASLVLSAMAHLPAPRPALVWVGDVADQTSTDALHEQANSAGVHFELKGMVSDAELVDLLNRALLVIHTPHLDPYGMAVLQAGACGAPIVAVAEGAARELIQDQVTGLLVEGSSAALAYAMNRLLSDRAVAARLAQSAQAMVAQRWSVSPAADRLEHRLSSIIAHRQRAGVIQPARPSRVAKTTSAKAAAQEAPRAAPAAAADQVASLAAGVAGGDRRHVAVFFSQNMHRPTSGYLQRGVAMLRALRDAGCRITLLGSALYAQPAWDQASIDALIAEGLADQVLIHTPDDADLRFVQRIRRRNSRRFLPFDSEAHAPPGARRWFSRTIEDLSPHAILMNYAHWDGLLDHARFASITRLIDAIDVISLNQEMQYAVMDRLPKTLINPAEVADELLDEDFFVRLNLQPSPLEFQIYDQYHHTIAISPRDAQIISQYTHRTKVTWAPMTEEPHYLQNSYAGPAIFATGPNYFNVQALLYFMRRVLPALLQRDSTFSLQVTGFCCERVLPSEGVVMSGMVPDLATVYENARFAVCPLLGGTGQSIKIIEAMAHGLPVVALRYPAIGSPILVHGESGFIADNAEEFAEYTAELWGNRELCARMGRAARRMVAEQHESGLLQKQLATMIF